MFPISDSIRHRKFPIITLLIISINIIVFLYELISGQNFIERWGLIPANVDFLNVNSFAPFITSQFLHGGFFHIISNMWFLWVFGNNVEDRMGKLVFPLFYLTAGVAAALLQYIFNTTSVIPMIGASGAVSGVLGAYFVFFPQAKIRSLLFFFFTITIAYIPATIYIFYWFVIQVISGVASIPALAGGAGGVAFWAHVGGFVAGYIIAKLYREEKKYIEGEIIE